MTSYSAQQAQEDYGLRGDFVRVAVHIRYTNTYGPSRDWCAFQLKLRQRGKTFEAKNVKYEGTSLRVGGGRGGSGSSPTGFIVWQEYETSSLASDETTVEIDTPDGQHVFASFDLSQLR